MIIKTREACFCPYRIQNGLDLRLKSAGKLPYVTRLANKNILTGGGGGI